jgi:FKBP-type peptidyl-prolyl cis-trans isomerase
MISKKQVITLVVVLVLIGLAGISMSVNKTKNTNSNQEGEQVVTQDQNTDEGDLTNGNEELINNIKVETNTSAKSKTMTDIKEFSYEVLKEGTGVAATANKSVTVDYKGMFLDGKIFDQGTFPFTLGIGQVVQGFDKGVLGMKVGETRKIYIPSEMGYGTRGAGATIPPNTDLIFEVTLKSIQ